MVLDEADTLIEMGFDDQIKIILHAVSKKRQMLLFSATMQKQLSIFINANLREPKIIHVDSDKRISQDVDLYVFTINQNDKPAVLLHLVREIIGHLQQTIIYVSTRHHVEFLQAIFTLDNLNCSCIYGSMDQSARKSSITKFRAGKVPILIVTDVAARGIDIPLLDNVINFDFPPKSKLFIHRTGRVARTGRPGKNFSLITREDMAYLIDLNLHLSRPLHTAKTSSNLNSSNKKLMSEANLLKEFTIYGSLPLTTLMMAQERYQKLLEKSKELKSYIKTCNNAYKLYCKSR